MRNRRADSKHELGRKLLNTGRRSGNTKSTARCQEEAQFLPIYECLYGVVVVAGCEASSLFVVQLEIDKNSTVFLTYIGWLSWRQRFARSSGCPVRVGRLQNHSAQPGECLHNYCHSQLPAQHGTGIELDSFIEFLYTLQQSGQYK